MSLAWFIHSLAFASVSLLQGSREWQAPTTIVPQTVAFGWTFEPGRAAQFWAPWTGFMCKTRRMLKWLSWICLVVHMDVCGQTLSSTMSSLSRLAFSLFWQYTTTVLPLNSSWNSSASDQGLGQGPVCREMIEQWFLIPEGRSEGEGRVSGGGKADEEVWDLVASVVGAGFSPPVSEKCTPGHRVGCWAGTLSENPEPSPPLHPYSELAEGMWCGSRDTCYTSQPPAVFPVTSVRPAHPPVVKKNPPVYSAMSLYLFGTAASYI